MAECGKAYPIGALPSEECCRCGRTEIVMRMRCLEGELSCQTCFAKWVKGD